MTLVSEEVCNYEGFELALAKKLIDADARTVCNDFFLKGKERIIVLSGLNQGGKTSFARTRPSLSKPASGKTYTKACSLRSAPAY
jgi:DNA mismatch repair protein MutS